MKVILSRKGFDSGNGGYPSPILPDDSLLSLPIPWNDKLRYSDLHFGEESYFDVMKRLSTKIKYTGRPKELLNRDHQCHLDPDIRRSAISRLPGWQPMFGQQGAAQTHLQNQRVHERDVFLFYGWFDRFDKEWEGLDRHVIFGYFQIGEVLRVKECGSRIKEWMLYHPHMCPDGRDDNNTIYVARETLSWDNNRPGAGVFKYRDELVLTECGQARSRWVLPEPFQNAQISWNHTRPSEQGYFQSNPIGQEFVVEEKPEIADWVKELISASALDTA